MAFALRSFHITINVFMRFETAMAILQQSLIKLIIEKPVAKIKPIIHTMISIMAAPVVLAYLTKNDFSGMPIMPPDENLLPKMR